MEQRDNKIQAESVGHCYVCKAELFRNDVRDDTSSKKEEITWVYHYSVGFVCIRHHGVREWYENKVKETEKELAKISDISMR